MYYYSTSITLFIQETYCVFERLVQEGILRDPNCRRLVLHPDEPHGRLSVGVKPLVEHAYHSSYPFVFRAPHLRLYH